MTIQLVYSMNRPSEFTIHLVYSKHRLFRGPSIIFTIYFRPPPSDFAHISVCLSIVYLPIHQCQDGLYVASKDSTVGNQGEFLVGWDCDLHGIDVPI